MTPLGRVVALLCGTALTLGAESPPEVEFVGRAPKLRIYPGGKTNSSNDTWIVLTFGAIEELDAKGGRVPGRAIASLAAEKGILWTQENRSIGGALAAVTRMELPLGFPDKCRAPAGGGGSTPPRSLGEEIEVLDADDDRRLATGSFVAVELFVFQADAVVDYGDFSLEVQRGQLKFNIEAASWPFCGSDHRLAVVLDVKVPGDKPPKEVKDRPAEEASNLDVRPNGTAKRPRGRKPKRKAMRQSAGNRDMDLDFPEAVLVGNSSEACEVLVDAKGGKTNIVFTFPYFDDTLLYDPTAGFVDDTEGIQAVVSGSLKMLVPDPAGFCASQQVMTGLKAAIARASKQNVSAVQVSCAVASTRRLALSRRLSGIVEVKYDITVPADASAPSADATVANLKALTTEQLSAIVTEELATASASMAVQVTEKSEPVSQTLAGATTTPGLVGATSAAPAQASASAVLLGLSALALLS